MGILEKQKDEMTRLKTVSLTNDRLLKEISALKERIFELEGEKMKLNEQLLEIKEENDDMEFRLLEFESRASPSRRITPDLSHVVLNDEGLVVKCNRLSTKYQQGYISNEELALMDKEKEIETIELRLEDLGERLRRIKHCSDYSFS